MKEYGAAIVLLFLSFQLFCCAGLMCKIGSIRHSRDPSVFTLNQANVQKCREDANYCSAYMCTKVGRLGFTQIIWSCSPNNDTSPACREAMNKLMEKWTRKKGHQCRCHFGEIGQDIGNEQFVLPPIPDGLMCKVGELNADAIGKTSKGLCMHDDHYCFMANCTKGNEFLKIEWGCTDYATLTNINAQIGQTAKAPVECKAIFGEKDLDYSNEHFTYSMLAMAMATTTEQTMPNSTSIITQKSSTTVKPRTTTNEGEPITGYYAGNNARGMRAMFFMEKMLIAFLAAFRVVFADL
ncbi:hypothetical protein niasHT_024725 [Heterodera trifolii]|uniref:Uncharacterized protein n=1 Tax=Heterodera trifolii TaxID=157864 RepID=A0ABD2K0V5_9BILA